MVLLITPRSSPEIWLYESHTVLHGRPFPLKGNFYANLFVYPIPVDPDDPSKITWVLISGWTPRVNEQQDPKKAEETRRKLAAYRSPTPTRSVPPR